MEISIDFDEPEPLYGCLASIPGLGGIGFARLISAFGSPDRVYGTDIAVLRKACPRLSRTVAASIAAGPDPRAWEKVLDDCRTQGIRVTAPGLRGYPAVLQELDGPPPLLYVRGEWNPADARAVALVGTRTPTAYGREAAHALARDLARAGVTIVSGLALGIDAAAHAGALEGGGRTLAVIGCGPDIPYPRENLELRDGIIRNGAVLSEHPPGTEPFQSNFPRRNRIISALARATVVVEAGRKSGALLTATHARDQGKPLFAVPGPIFSNVSEGSNTLLREGALLAVSASDVLAAIDGRIPAEGASRPAGGGPGVSNATRSNFAPAERSGGQPLRPRKVGVPTDPVLRLWGDDLVCPLDRLAERARGQGLWPSEETSPALLAALLQLELRGHVQRLPGAVFRRTG